MKIVLAMVTKIVTKFQYHIDPETTQKPFKVCWPLNLSFRNEAIRHNCQLEIYEIYVWIISINGV